MNFENFFIFIVLYLFYILILESNLIKLKLYINIFVLNKICQKFDMFFISYIFKYLKHFDNFRIYWVGTKIRSV